MTGEVRTTPVDLLPPSPHLLVTGGAGFIGSAFVRDVLRREDGTKITVLDKLTYAGNTSNLEPVARFSDQFEFFEGDIAKPRLVRKLLKTVDAVVNFAAESHVDRSILHSEAFLRTGVIGVDVLLDAVRRQNRPVRFLQVSTDEVYGSKRAGHSSERDPLSPRSPYAAAKAAGELLIRSYFVTHRVDVVVTRGANTYGPFQHLEKLIPLFITNAIDDLSLPLYGDGLQRRDWLHVSDHAGAIEYVLHHGVSGETYNIPGSAEMTNREIVTRLLRLLGKPMDLIRKVPDRPGHDRRYAMSGDKLFALGWRNRVEFDSGLAQTVAWYRENENWWRAIKSGDWHEYYDRQYSTRFAFGRAAAWIKRQPATSEPAG